MLDRNDDFGLTALAANSFYQLWWMYHDGAVAVVEAAAAAAAPETLAQWVRDARLLLSSPLAAEELDALWESAARGHCDAASAGLDGRSWLERIIQIATAAPEWDDGLSAEEPLDLRPDAVAGVVEIVDHFAPTVLFSRHDEGAAFLRAALARLARSGRPELALRFFIRLSVTHDSPVSVSLRARVGEVGALFGYGPFLIGRLDVLLDEDSVP